MNDRVADLQEQILNLQKELSEARRQVEPEPVGDYQLTRSTGESVNLSDLFGDNDDLILIHNMGKGCVYCTLWADGFQGVLPHLQNRASFAVVSPDPPRVQREFAESRGWTFPLISAQGTTFISDLGFADRDGSKFQPGFSAFHRNADGAIVRTGRDEFGPGDSYAPIWHLFDCLQNGANDWEPKYSYS